MLNRATSFSARFPTFGSCQCEEVPAPTAPPCCWIYARLRSCASPNASPGPHG